MDTTEQYFKDIARKKAKKYIIIGIISFVTVTLIIVIAVVVSNKNKKTQPNQETNTSDSTEDSDTTKPTDSTDSDSTDSSDTSDSGDSSESTEPVDLDYIYPDCSGYCNKPYDIKVYSDTKLTSKLEECGYQKNSALFNFVLEAVKTHNILRACHNAPPLLPNCEIMKISQDYAETMPSGHSGTRYHGQWMGENLFWSWGMNLDGAFAVNDWYSEISNYDFNTHGSKGGVVGHFTQVVWKSSLEVGIGYYCQGTKCCVVGNYYPGGNYNNLDATNVLPLQ